MLLLVWLVAGAYYWSRAPRGWIPHDEGTLAESAVRVLGGGMPHVDYDEPYTGGVAVLHAAAFRIAGVSILTLRLTLYALFVGFWVPAAYYVATRVAPPLAAGAAMLLAIAWGLPTYFAAMPSWYNTLFATLGLAALFRFLERGRRRWLFAAGVAAGLSILAKVTGLYFVAAVLLVLVRREQRLASGGAPAAEGGRWYRAFVFTALGGFVCVVVLTFRRFIDQAVVFHILAPTVAIVAYLGAEELATVPNAPDRVRLVRLMRLVAPFVLGVAVPVTAFAVPYVVSGSIGALLRGVFVVPSQLGNLPYRPLPPIFTLVATAPVALALLPIDRPARSRLGVSAAVAVALLWLLTRANDAVVYIGVLASIRTVVPVIALGALRCIAQQRGAYTDARREQVFALVSVTVVCSFIQLPFAAPFYLYCVGAFAILAVVATLHGRTTAVRGGPGMLAAFYGAFGIFFLTPKETRERSPDAVALPLTRAGIHVNVADRATYAAVVREVRAIAPPGSYVYAEPECPEVNFLSATRSPTRNIFSDLGDPNTRTARTLAALRARDVRVAVINTQPIHFGALPAALLDTLRSDYPHHRTVGKFEVRWRD